MVLEGGVGHGEERPSHFLLSCVNAVKKHSAANAIHI
jgi:hypothetical protein